MSNRRLYIEDTTTGERFTLAKGWGAGWQLCVMDELVVCELDIWFRGRDRAASESPELETTLRIVSDD